VPAPWLHRLAFPLGTAMSSEPAEADSRLQTWAPWLRASAALLAGAVLVALYVRGTWWLAGVCLLPWLWWLDQPVSLPRQLLKAWLLCLAFITAGFGWFGTAIEHYAQWPSGTGLLALLILAPLFQPQVMAWALARHWAQRRGQPAWVGAIACAAWITTEWAFPKVLGDTLGHGLYPSDTLRQGAAVIGATGLTLALLVFHEAALAAVKAGLKAYRRHSIQPGKPQAAAAGGAHWRALAVPLGWLVAIPTSIAIYGLSDLNTTPDSTSQPQLRMGLVQANLADYETRRREQGSYAVVREVLDLHYAMSHDAVERQGVDAVLWSETVYPTTFAKPRSPAGAEFDREIASVVEAAGVPFVFGTYDRDESGEYNAAAFMQPGQGLLGMYRKTRLFPLTEYLPSWIDDDWAQRWLPWAGRWKPGTGARVFPLRLRNGQEVIVAPLICRDDVDPALALAGARLGARALLTMSNDSWFSRDPLGTRLHHAVAAFRSIETGLPQFRVTTNGYSAVIDRRGRVLASGEFGQRTLLVGSLPTPEPAPTPLMRWGHWLGPLAALAIALWALSGWLPRWRWSAAQIPPMQWPARVYLMPRSMRWICALLRATARLSLVALATLWLIDEPFRNQTLAQLRYFAALVVAPELAALCLMAGLRAWATIEPDGLHLKLRSGQALRISGSEVASCRLWRLPMPGPGLQLSGGWSEQPLHLALDQPQLLLEALKAQAPHIATASHSTRGQIFAWASQWRGTNRLNKPLWKFVVLPLALALPAFTLHQRIAYGGILGEWTTFGPQAWVGALLIWWGVWALAVAATASVLRLAVECLAWATVWHKPQLALPVRAGLERAALALLYAGLPLWLAYRLLQS
jgi:apolipoprotein N-acyltransferase